MDYLYHYTSIETLYYIFKSRSIKFNRLDNVNDLMDGKSKDVEGIEKLYFASCWTMNNEESIPLWNLYTPKMSGVRIKLKKFPFLYLCKIDGHIHEISHDEIIKFNSSIDPYLAFPQEHDIIEKCALLDFNPTDSFLYEIKYKSHDEFSLPQFFEKSKGCLGTDVYEIASCKTEYWSFEKEWRYILRFKLLSDFDDSLTQEQIVANYQSIDFKTSSIYFKLHHNAFENSEVMIGPNCNEYHNFLVNELITKFNIEMKVVNSKLSNKIRL